MNKTVYAPVVEDTALEVIGVSGPNDSEMATPRWKRAMDILIAVLLLPAAAPLFAMCYFAVALSGRGPVLHWSRRVGRGNGLFMMPKFRTMRVDTPQLATHLLARPENYVTPVGRLLRKTSLDELPQLFSVLKGDLSLVGPRPALFNQDNLIALRTRVGVHRLRPGITGLAQVRGRDDLSIAVKVRYDVEYMNRKSPWTDLKLLFLTMIKVLNASGVHH